jgi:cytidine deaminase
MKRNRSCEYQKKRIKPCGKCQYCIGELAHTKEFLEKQKYQEQLKELYLQS